MPKNRILAIVLFVIGGLIFTCLLAFLILQDYILLAGLLLGSLLITGGVGGMLFMRRDKEPPRAGAAPRATPTPQPRARASQTAPKAKPAAPSSEEKLKRLNKTPRVHHANLELAFGAAAGGALLCIALLLMCNLTIELLPLLNTRETQVVACEDVAAYTEDGWHLVSNYTYPLEDTPPDQNTYYACVIERDTWLWAKHTPESAVLTPTLSAEFTTTLGALSMPTLTVPTAPATETPTLKPSPEPTQTPLPTPTFTPKPTATFTPRPTPTALPSPTPRTTATPMTTASSPLPTPTMPTSTVQSLPLFQALGPIQNTTYDVTYTVQITVTDIESLKPEELTEPLPSGFTYAIVYVTIKNLGPGPLYDLSAIDFHIREAEGVSREPVALSTVAECNLELVDLFPTEDLTACMAFEVRRSGPLDFLYAPEQLDALEDGQYLRFTLRP